MARPAPPHRRTALQADANAVLERHRRLWLSGLPGVGKSTLAAELLRARGGVWVAAGTLDGPGQLGGAVARAVRFPGEAPSPEGLARWCEGLGLLVLDEVDHVGDEARAFMDGLAAAVPVVATSRVATAAEWHLAVQPLGVEEAAAVVAGAAPARTVEPVDPADPRLAVVAEALGGLPLALSLAAARLSVLTLGELAAELTTELGLDLLRDPTRTSVGVEAALAATVRTAGPGAADALARLSVFAGDFGRSAAGALLGRPSGVVLDVLQTLAHHHLLDPVEVDGQSRYRLHPLVRTWARARLPPEVWRELVALHAEVHAEEGRRQVLRTHGAEVAEAQAWLHRETVELTEVVRRASAGEVPAVFAAEAVLALSARWDTPLEEPLFAAALALARAAGDVASVGRLLLARADAGPRKADPGLEADAREAATCLTRAGRSGEAAFARGLAAAHRLAERPSAEDLSELDAAIDAVTDEGHRARLRQLRAVSGAVPPERQVEDKRAFLAWARQAGSPIVVAHALFSLSTTEQAVGRLADADAHLDEALVVLGDRPVPFSAHILGADAVRKHLRGDLDGARATWLRVVALLEQLGAEPGLEAEKVRLALLLVERGEEASGLGLRPERLLPRWVGVRAAHEVVRTVTALRAGRSPDSVPEGSPALVAWGEGVAALAATSAAFAVGERAAAAVALDRARAALARVEGAYPWPVARRIGERLVEEAARALVSWRVARDGRGFEPPDGPWVDLGTRESLARLVAAFADGRAHTVEDLAAAGWPGERAAPASLRNRVYVALTTLRKLGFSLLETTDAGWRVDPSVPVVWLPVPLSPASGERAG